MNIDFKNFHKIETDDKSTTLVHPDGHKIKISHNSLSPQNKKELDKLPIKMAKGGMSKPSGVSKAQPNSAQVPEAAYTPPKQAKMAFTEPDNQGANPFDEDIVVKALHREAPPMGPLTAEKPHYPPCINPSCKSYGHSHPNCRCYGGNPEGKPSGEMNHRFAEGGNVESFCSQDRAHEEGCQYFAAKGLVDEPMDQPVDAMPVSPAQDDQAAAAPVSQPAEANPNPEVSASQPAAPQQPLTPEQDAQQHGEKVSQHLMNEDAAVKSDINAGHITPETYKDLFDKKDTLGKIGTLFGLLVGGAGSGLSHQPNVLMQMMDQTIQNDLKGQQESAANRQNLLKINQDNLINNANIGLTQQQAKQLALQNSYMNANRMALDSLVKANSKLPEGSPQRQQGDQMLALLSQHVDQKNASIASQAGMAQALAKMASGNQGNGQPNTTFMKSGMMGPEFKEMGADIEQKTIPGVPGRASRPVEEHDRQQVQAMNVLSDKANDLINYAKQHKGTLSPSQRAIAAQKAEEMVNFYNNSIQGGVLTQGRLKWLDDQISKNPTGVVTQLLGNQSRLEEIKNSNDHRRDLLLNTYGYPKAQGQQQVAQSDNFKMVNGVKYKRGPNGEAIKVK